MNLDRTTCSDFKHSIGVPENIGAVPFDQKAFEMVQPSQWWPGQSRRSKVRLKRVSIMDSPCPNSYVVSESASGPMDTDSFDTIV